MLVCPALGRDRGQQAGGEGRGEREGGRG